MSQVIQARKKPVVVRCFQWDGSGDGAEAIQKAFPNAKIDVLYTSPLKMQVNTLEGIMRVSPGDYIIEGVNGEYYPCKPEIFAKTYDILPPEVRSCNLHSDCDKEDQEAIKAGYKKAFHCNDDSCNEHG